MTPPKPQKFHAILTRPGFAGECAAELKERFQVTPSLIGKGIVTVPESTTLPALPDLIFARQSLPHVFQYGTVDVTTLVDLITKRLEVIAKRAGKLDAPWTLHAFAIDDDDALQIAIKSEKALLSRLKTNMPQFAKRFVAAETFDAEPRDANDLLLQIYVSSTDGAWFSLSTVREGASTAIGGMRRMKKLAGAPSRSASKLEEALAFMGTAPKPGQTAVDLGAAPGGWTFVMARHGADVKAIDHAELAIPNATKLKGKITHLKENGLKYLPSDNVDWLVCDMVMGGRQTLDVLKQWCDSKKMSAFVVNVKLPAAKPWPTVLEVIKFLATLEGWSFLKAKHLFHDRAEITVMGHKASP